MNIFKRALSLVFILSMFMTCITVAYANSVETEIITNYTEPSAYLYANSECMANNDPMLAPYKSWNGNIVYCVGLSTQITPPTGTTMEEATELNDDAIERMIAAGYPYTKSQYGLNNRDYHYVTQCAIRCYIMHRNTRSVVCNNESMLSEFHRICQAINQGNNPTIFKIMINGGGNKTTVNINGVDYYRFGPYYLKINNGKLVGNYNVQLSNDKTFHTYNAFPTVASSYDEEYISSDSFYVFTPTTADGSTNIKTTFNSNTVTQSIAIYGYTTSNSSIQPVACVKLNLPFNVVPITMELDWSGDGTAPPDIPEVPEKRGNIEVHKITEGMLNIKGIVFNLTGTSDTGKNIDIQSTPSDENGIAYFENIPVGTYTITEQNESVPYGYLVADSKTVIVKYAETVNLEIYNQEKTGILKVKKSTIMNKHINNIKFHITGTSDTGREINQEIVTDKNGEAQISVPIGTYTITEDEKSVPYGYYVAEPYQQTVIYAEENIYSDIAEIYNQERRFRLKMCKTTEGKFNIANIGFRVQGTAYDGEVIDKYALTDKNGKIEFDIPMGSYIITEDEKTVPYGYVVAEPFEMYVYETTAMRTWNVKNNEMTGSIKLQKITATMKDISDIQMRLYGTSDTGREIEMIATTDKNGVATFENVPIGTYSIYEDEKTVPYGYMAGGLDNVVVTYAQETNVTLLNLRNETPPTTSINSASILIVLILFIISIFVIIYNIIRKYVS